MFLKIEIKVRDTWDFSHFYGTNPKSTLIILFSYSCIAIPILSKARLVPLCPEKSSLKRVDFPTTAMQVQRENDNSLKMMKVAFKLESNTH